MGFRFEHYDVDELEKCGQEFQREFSTADVLWSYPKWTEKVLDWFDRTAADGIRVYPPPREFIVDLCHTTYPKDEGPDGRKFSSAAWYALASGKECQVKLALESEWGKWGYADVSLGMVLDDACKLAVLRADEKVMVFASHWEGDRMKISKALAALRKSHGDTAPWLLIDVPNNPTKDVGLGRQILCEVLNT